MSYLVYCRTENDAEHEFHLINSVETLGTAKTLASAQMKNGAVEIKILNDREIDENTGYYRDELTVRDEKDLTHKRKSSRENKIMSQEQVLKKAGTFLGALLSEPSIGLYYYNGAVYQVSEESSETVDIPAVLADDPLAHIDDEIIADALGINTKSLSVLCDCIDRDNHAATIDELKEKSGFTWEQFCEYTHIPRPTLRNLTPSKQFLINLIEMKLELDGIIEPYYWRNK